MTGIHPPKDYRRGRFHHLENTVTVALTRAGLVPDTYLLTTVGRKSGRSRSNLVTIVRVGGRRWLVAPYGAVPWVLNARAAGAVTISRRAHVGHFDVREVSAEEAGPVLKRYVAIAPVTRPYFAADRDAPVADFAAEAAKHPVFELVRAARRGLS